MSLPIPATTLGANYTAFGGGSLYGSGYILVANGPVDIQILYGRQTGQSGSTLVQNVAAGQYTFLAPERNLISGLNIRAAGGTVTSPAQVVQGQLFEPTIPGLIPVGSGVIVEGGQTAFSRVTTLPGSPTDGQAVLLDLNAAFPGVEWLCVFNIATGYWDVVGGTPIDCGPSGSVPPDAGWHEQTFIVVPNAGDYHVCLTGGTFANLAGTAFNMRAGVSKAGGIPANPEIFTVQTNNSDYLIGTQSVLLTSFTVGQHASMMAQTDNFGGGTNFSQVTGYVIPRRIQ